MADAAKIILTEGDAPATPAAGTSVLYLKTDHLGYTKDADGAEHAWYQSGGTDVVVADGGTGVSTLLDHGVLLGSGTDAVSVTAVGTNGQLLKGVTSSDPIWSTTALTDGTNTFNIANGTASLDVAAGCTINFDKDFSVTGYGTTITGAGQANTLTLNESLTVGDGYSGTVTFSAASKTLTVSDTSAINQDVSTTAGPTWDHVHTASIIAPANTLVIKPTTDATTAIKIADKDGNAIMTVDTTNNRVGIGTTSPSKKLEIYGGALDGLKITSSASSPQISLKTTTPSTTSGGIVWVKSDDTTGPAILSHNTVADNNLEFYTDGIKMVIKNDGNVGIGTTTFGTSAAKVLAIGSGTAPTTSPADAAQLWVEDYNGAGTARFCMRDEEGNSGPIAFLSDTQPFYGVTWDESADTYARTGSLAGYKTGAKPPDAVLSIQRRMRGCVVADDGTVNYYLCATDWTKKEDGATASDLTGTDGQVMVEIPKFWYRYGYSGTTHTWEVSPVPLTGFKVHEAFMSDDTEKDYLYFGAYEACLYDVSASKYVGQCYQTSVSAVFATSDDSITIATRTGWATALAVGQKLVITGTLNNNATVTVKTIESATKITVDENLTDETAATTVIHAETDVTDTTGDVLASVSGVCPITGGSANGTRAHFRTWAENRGGGKAANDAASFQWSQEFGDALAALQLLYLTEYASFYSQSVLGYGIAAVTDWAAYNGYNPIAKTGNGNAVGNASGNTATAAITTGAGAQSVYLKYRGIENLYGHIGKFIDGYKVNNNIPYLCNNFANFSDAESTANYTNPTDVNGAAITMHNGDGYQGTLELTGRGFFPASLTGGSASAKITDYYYQASGWRVVLSGGGANDAARDGAFNLNASNVLAYVHWSIGGRLVGRK